MVISFYGKQLSQDRIAYYTEEEAPAAGDGEPERDLAHDVGMSYWSGEETDTLEWAVGDTVTFMGTPNPTFADLRGWLDANRPIMTRTSGSRSATGTGRCTARSGRWRTRTRWWA